MESVLIESVDEREQAEPVVVPHGELSADALRGVIESFVLREGTDYGERDVSLDDKVEQVMRQLERGEARILFDPATDSIHMVVRGQPGWHGRG
jgi:uncharacterized protein YheU (UPF0270 family)